MRNCQNGDLTLSLYVLVIHQTYFAVFPDLCYLLQSAFELSGFSSLEVNDILQAIATILNIGNLTFAPMDNEENSTVSSPDGERCFYICS